MRKAAAAAVAAVAGRGRGLEGELLLPRYRIAGSFRAIAACRCIRPLFLAPPRDAPLCPFHPPPFPYQPCLAVFFPLFSVFFFHFNPVAQQARRGWLTTANENRFIMLVFRSAVLPG